MGKKYRVLATIVLVVAVYGIMLFIKRQEPEYIQGECVNPDNIANVYEYYEEFPFETMEYIDEDAFEYVEGLYSEINFESDFAKGEMGLSDLYIEKYKQLLIGEIPFVDKDTGEENYLPEYKEVFVYDGEKYIYDVNEYEYLFFDMDKDEAPELCIYVKGVASSPANTKICIFKFNMEQEKMILWEQLSSCYFYIYGSSIVGCDWQGGTERGFYCLDENAEIKLKLSFVEDVFAEDMVYMVSLPGYLESDKQIYVPTEIECQLYYDNCEKLYYLRVTEEQYYELTEKFFEGRENAMQYVRENGVLYNELFE